MNEDYSALDERVFRLHQQKIYKTSIKIRHDLCKCVHISSKFQISFDHDYFVHYATTLILVS